MKTGGGSDGNFTGALGIPTLDGLGADGKGAHTHDEFVYFSSLEERAKLMLGLFKTLHKRTATFLFNLVQGLTI